METKMRDMATSLEDYDFATMMVENKKLGKNLLVAMKKQPKGKIMLFDATRGFDEVATILYNINAKGVYVSEFMVNVEYQQCGLGKYIFCLAMAHGDARGKTQVYGEANPTDPIKGVSENGNYETEARTICEIYKKLGCIIEDGDKFKQEWKQGEILNMLGEEERKLIDMVNEDQSSL